MNISLSFRFATGLLGLSLGVAPATETNLPFTGQIRATQTRGGETQTFLTTAGTNCLRLERGETDRPYARNLIERQTGEVTLLFPHNRSYVVLSRTTSSDAPPRPGLVMPAAPPGIGPQGSLPTKTSTVGPTNLPGVPPPPAMTPMPAFGGGMPMLPPMAMMNEPVELKATDTTTNLLGIVCQRYELRQRGEVMEIWAVKTNLPFAVWMQNQPPRFGPQMIEERWGKIVADKELFPLLAVLKLENGPERLRYEVKSVSSQRPEDQPPELFSPPDDYQQLETLPF